MAASRRKKSGRTPAEDPLSAAALTKTLLSGEYEKLIGRRLRDWRTGKGWPLKRVATDLGVSVPTVSDWEKGFRFPSGQHLLKLAVLYDTPVCHLLCAGLKLCPIYQGEIRARGRKTRCSACSTV